jgi:hypothetical protein
LEIKKGETDMKTISILLALLNTLVAGLILAMSASAIELRESGALWSVIKGAAALIVIAAGALAWLDGVRPKPQVLMFASGLSMVALGSAVFVWTIHLAQVTGDMEAYMLLFGISLIVQGGASVMGVQQEPHRQVVS